LDILNKVINKEKIKMTANQLLNAFPIVEKLMTFNLPIKKAYQLYSLAKQINEKRDFFIKEEKKLIDNFKGQIMEDGKIKFENINLQQEFLKAHNELLQCEIDDIKPLELTFDDLKDIKLSPADLIDLEGVVNIVE
jgi:hypothetical protein